MILYSCRKALQYGDADNQMQLALARDPITACVQAGNITDLLLAVSLTGEPPKKLAVPAIHPDRGAERAKGTIRQPRIRHATREGVVAAAAILLSTTVV